MAIKTEEAIRLLDVNPFGRAKSYIVQFVMGLLGLPWTLLSPILDTEADPIFIRRGANHLWCVNDVKTMKPNRLRSAADTSLQVTGRIQFLKQLGNLVNRTGFLVV